MAEYNHREIESKWQKHWKDKKVYEVPNTSEKPKYYILDMFPYPSGAGLHVGHPLGYIASDIIARYKRLTGHNVLHPMGFDSFGLPAEQYAIKTGQHPAITTQKNIERYKEQLQSMGYSFDWSREVRTSDPEFYKWTQWIFLKLFNSYYDKHANKARPIAELEIPKGLSEYEKRQFIDNHRLAYQADIMVNWCPGLGTVLANEEVIGGVSERGGYPVIRKPMKQWMLRITEFADRLLNDLEELDWPESIKLSQQNWIGKSYGAEIDFKETSSNENIKVFTTRPDTIYGVTYMVLAPEHPLVSRITTTKQQKLVDEYVEQASRKSDLERQELDKSKTGVFTGAFAINPISNEEIPIWISDYVLISYGTGAIMAVPGGDQRDFEFAQKFDLPIVQVVSPDGNPIENQEEAYAGHGKLLNSAEYNGMNSQEFIKVIIERIESEGKGKATTNYKLRDWIFTRQRYWGEPIPVIHREDGTVEGIPENELPLELPEVESFKGTVDGESPLAAAESWVATTDSDGNPARRETNTMPQWGGSCWYYLRYLDPHNNEEMVQPDKEKYWMNVDFYIGGAEHAVLHLLYARFWHKVLYDLGYVSTKEPFQKLINQGMIQGRSSFVYKIDGENRYVSNGLKNEYKTAAHHVDISLVKNDILDIEGFKKSRSDAEDAEFILENEKYVCGWEIEKMSKSKYNVVNPDDLIHQYGADTFRMYEMFLGPIEASKPWNTNGIEGVYKFLRKFWGLFHNGEVLEVSEEDPSKEELKILHQLIIKITEDVDDFSLNTSVSAFMIAVNELSALKCNKRSILEPMVICLSPFAPHISEELWHQLGNETTVVEAKYPSFDESHLVEDSIEYPVSINGKMRVKIAFPADAPKDSIEAEVLRNEVVQKWLDGKQAKRVIVVPKKIVNVVV